MNTHCGKSRPFAHNHRWTRSADGTRRTRWVHGWFVVIAGTATKEWKNKNSFVLSNRGFVDETDAIVIRRENISSVSAAMTQALAMVCALRGLNLGVREPHALPKEKRT